MELRVDAAEITAFGARMGAAPGIVRSELSTMMRGLGAEGVGLAQGFAPVDTGRLRGAITIIRQSALEVVYGPVGVIYARIREVGGTIVGRPWLVFQVDGRWVKVRSVTQRGSFYLRRSRDALAPRVEAAGQAAMRRIAAALGF